MDEGWAVQETVSEAAVALRLSERVVERQMSLGHRLRQLLPATLQAWEQGRMTRRHAETIYRETLEVGDSDRLAEIESELLMSVDHGCTPAQLRSLARRLCDTQTPDVLVRRHEMALAERRADCEFGANAHPHPDSGRRAPRSADRRADSARPG